MNIQYAINFSRKFTATEIDIIDYLTNHNNTYTGNFYHLAEQLGRRREVATNIRKSCIALKDKGVINITSQRGKAEIRTYITLKAENLKEV